MNSSLSQQRRGSTFILLSTLGYSFFSVFTHGVQAGGLQPLDIVLWRFGIGTMILWTLIQLRRGAPPTMPIPRIWILLSGPLLAIAALSAFYGLTLVPASVFLLIYYSYPAMVALIAVLRGERQPLAVWLALAVTLLGVAVSVPSAAEGLAGANLGGIALALLNAFVVALFFLLSGQALRHYSDTLRATTWSISGATLLMLLIAPFRVVSAPNGLTVWANLLGLILVSSIMPILALNAGIRLIGAVQASLLSMTEPVLSLLFAFLLLGDRLMINQVIGGALILASVVFIQVWQIRNPSQFNEKP